MYQLIYSYYVVDTSEMCFLFLYKIVWKIDAVGLIDMSFGVQFLFM